MDEEDVELPANAPKSANGSRRGPAMHSPTTRPPTSATTSCSSPSGAAAISARAGRQLWADSA
jgi:hypothetical protein